jgi:hypothetical protein
MEKILLNRQKHFISYFIYQITKCLINFLLYYFPMCVRYDFTLLNNKCFFSVLVRGGDEGDE